LPAKPLLSRCLRAHRRDERNISQHPSPPRAEYLETLVVVRQGGSYRIGVAADGRMALTRIFGASSIAAALVRALMAPLDEELGTKAGPIL